MILLVMVTAACTAAVAETQDKFFLTPDERDFLRAMPPLAVGFNTGLLPYSYVDDSGHVNGMAIDYLNYLRDTLGLQFQIRPAQNAKHAIDEMHDGRLDMLAVAVSGDEILRGLAVSQPYAVFPVVVIGRNSALPLGHLRDLAGKQVVVTEAGGVGVLVRREVPEVRLTIVPSVRAGLALVADGAADAYVDDIASTDIELHRSYAGKLRVIGSAEHMLGIGFAVSPSLAARLVPLIDRALRSLPEQMRLAIQNRYVAAGHTTEASWMEVLWRASPIVAVLLIVVLFLLRSQRLLRKEGEAAEAASQAKDGFLAMMSHEIRTPMSGVLGLAELLSHTSLTREQAATVNMIEDSAGALLQILDDILDYSKIEAGSLDIEAQPVDIRELCDITLGLLAARAYEKGLLLRFQVDAQVAAVVLGDGVRLRQILFNLLGNAIKFTEFGIVSLSVTCTREEHGMQTLYWQVTDSGIGISPEAQGRLFEPFVQADTSTTRRFGGTGLGLAICRQLVALMNGSIRLKSVPGVGTQAGVEITLPIVERSHARMATAGARFDVRIPDAAVGRALTALLIAAGATPCDDRAGLYAQVVFLADGEDCPPVAHGRPKPVVVHVSERPKLAGYRLTADDVRLSINPLSWRAVVGATMMALTRHGPESSLEPGPTAQQPVRRMTREEAIARGQLILVAEDHATNRILLERQLSLLGYACDAVEDGEQALASLSGNAYALLITDCHMPVVNGYELARRIRLAEADMPVPLRHLPIIAITASTEAEEAQRCKEAGMDECLTKPTQLNTLRGCLERWLAAGHEMTR